MSDIATRSFNLHWANTILKLVTLLGGIVLASYATPVAAQSYQPLKASIAQMNVEKFFNQGVNKTERGDLLGDGNQRFVRYRLEDKPGAIADLQKAAQIFLDQENTASYQQTLIFIQMIQPSPNPQSSALPPCPEMF